MMDLNAKGVSGMPLIPQGKVFSTSGQGTPEDYSQFKNESRDFRNLKLEERRLVNLMNELRATQRQRLRGISSMSKEIDAEVSIAIRENIMKSNHTGHKNVNMEDGKTLVDWITETVKDESSRYGVPMPSKKQMALVISALRMHTIIMHASNYDTSELGKPDQITNFYPIQSSVGRYFRDSAQITLEEEL